MKHIFIQTSGRSERKQVHRQFLLLGFALLLVSGVFALSFTLQNSTIEFGQSITSQTIPELVTSNMIYNIDANSNTSYSGSGYTWKDISGNGNDFVVPGGSSPGSTQAPTTYQFNGTTTSPNGTCTAPTFSSSTQPKYFVFTRTATSGSNSPTGTCFQGLNSWLSGKNFTVAAWIKTTQVGGGYAHYKYMAIVACEYGGVNGDWSFGIDSAGNLAFGTGGTASGKNDLSFSTSTLVNTGSWVYVAVTRTYASSGTGYGVVTFYVNGSKVATNACYLAGGTTSTSCTSTTVKNAQNANGNSIVGTNTYLEIGTEDDSPGYSFGGDIGAEYGWNQVMTDSQILQNYNASKSQY